jgi:hypothetical protein
MHCLGQEVIECLMWHSLSYNHKKQFSSYIGQVIKKIKKIINNNNKKYIYC